MKKYVSLAIFFLRTFHFNPLNNPVFVLIVILLVFFYVEGSLDKYHIALMLYLSVLGHCFIGNMFRPSREEERNLSHVPMTRHFQALPVSGRGIFISYFLSSTLYAIIISSALVILLTQFMKLPDLADMEFTRSVAPDGDTITTVTGIAFSRRFIPRFVSFVLEKSLLFDLIAKTGGAPLLICLYFVLAYVYISVFQVFNECRRLQRKSLLGLFHRLPFGVYFLFALIFLTEVMLSQREIGIGTRFILHRLDVTLLFLIVSVVLTILSIALMSTAILSKLKDLSA
jgi:hypothetical protein